MARRRAPLVRVAQVAASVAAVGGYAACSEAPGVAVDSAPSPGAAASREAESKAAAGVVAAIRARFPGAIAGEGLLRLEPAAGGALVARGGAAPVELPADATGAARVTDATTGLSVRFALEGASAAPVVQADGVALYRGAAPGGGDVIHAVTAAGTEDFVHFAAAPAVERLHYRVELSGVAGLRLVDRTLELLDGKGVPRLRVAPPELVDAAGRHVRADLGVEGCAVDESPRPPWGRAAVAPGASACTVSVAWGGRGVAYPALVDPSWVTTKTMVVERARHALAALPNPVVAPGEASPVLITGGFDKNGLPLASAELYEPLSRTFAVTGAMAKPRAAHTATALPTSPVGQIFVAGGAGSMLDPLPPERLAITSLTDSASTELYNPQTGVFTAGPAMSTPRYQHTATALPDGRVLLVGGISDLVNQPTKSADLFTFDAASPPGTIAPTAGPMAFSRSAHAATRLASGDVLVTGGVGSATFALLSAEVYCVSSGCAAGLDHFGTLSTQMTAARAFHTAVTLADGDVLVAGGVNAVSAPISYQATADLLDHGSGAFQLQAIAMGGPRAFHTATVLAPPELFVPNPVIGTAQSAAVVLAGGFGGTADLAGVEAYFPATKTIQALGAASMAVTRRHAAAWLVNAGDGTLAGRGVLVTGGVSGSSVISGTLVNGKSSRAAEVLVKTLGEPCAAAGECLSGFCHDGVCCDVACTQDCWACSAEKKEGATPSGTCGPTKSLTELVVHCFEDPGTNEYVEMHPVCNGLGAVIAGPKTQSCKPGVCGSDGHCAHVCADDGGCSSTGWCDKDAPPDDAGAPDGGGTIGTCKTKKEPGLACKRTEECFSGFCVDGVCCNEACTDQCTACNLAQYVGTCRKVNDAEPDGAPHPNPDPQGNAQRPQCAGSGTTCGGVCGPTSIVDCKYPTATEAALAPPVCTDVPGGLSTLVRTPCDGKGASTTDPGDCGGFKCHDASTCKTTCASDADCSQDYICQAGDAGPATCRHLDAPVCDGDKTLRQAVDKGGYVVCADHYACPAGAPACLTACDSVADCVDGFVCDGSHKCVEPLPAPLLPSCAAAPAPAGERGAGWAALLGAVALWVARRRRG